MVVAQCWPSAIKFFSNGAEASTMRTHASALIAVRVDDNRGMVTVALDQCTHVIDEASIVVEQPVG